MRPETQSELTEVVDGRTGTIRARGRLTGAGADLLRGSVTALRDLGHRRVVLDLRDLETIDADGLRDLHLLQQEVRAADGEVVLLDLTGPIGEAIPVAASARSAAARGASS